MNTQDDELFKLENFGSGAFNLEVDNLVIDENSIILNEDANAIITNSSSTTTLGLTNTGSGVANFTTDGNLRANTDVLAGRYFGNSSGSVLRSSLLSLSLFYISEFIESEVTLNVSSQNQRGFIIVTDFTGATTTESHRLDFFISSSTTYLNQHVDWIVDFDNSGVNTIHEGVILPVGASLIRNSSGILEHVESSGVRVIRTTGNARYSFYPGVATYTSARLYLTCRNVF